MSDDGIQVWAPMEVVEALLARAEKAEAAIDRVVRLAANWQRRFDSSIRHPADIASIPIEEVFAALDGDDDE